MSGDHRVAAFALLFRHVDNLLATFGVFPGTVRLQQTGPWPWPGRLPCARIGVLLPNFGVSRSPRTTPGNPTNYPGEPLSRGRAQNGFLFRSRLFL